MSAQGPRPGVRTARGRSKTLKRPHPKPYEAIFHPKRHWATVVGTRIPAAQETLSHEALAGAPGPQKSLHDGADFRRQDWEREPCNFIQLPSSFKSSLAHFLCPLPPINIYQRKKALPCVTVCHSAWLAQCMSSYCLLTSEPPHRRPPTSPTLTASFMSIDDPQGRRQTLGPSLP